MKRSSWPLLLLAACRPDDVPSVTADPADLPLTGYVRVALDLSRSGLSAAEVESVAVAGVPAYDLEADGDVLTVTVQGAPEAGPADVALRGAEGVYTFPGAIHYKEPLDPAFARVVAIGASLGMGVQSGVPTRHGQLHSPPAVIARQLGAWLPPPLLVEDLFRPVGVEDIGPPPGCALPDTVALAAAAATESLALLRDPETGDFGFQWGRVSPELAPRNLAVGGSAVADLVEGPGDFGESFLTHLVYEPYAGLADDVTHSQLELVEQLSPTLVFSVDPAGNDLIDMVLGESLDPTLATPREAYTAAVTELVERLAATGAAVFLGNTPDVNLLARAELLAEATVAAGASPEEVAALQAEIRAVVVDYNAILSEVAAGHQNVFVVDVFSATDAIYEQGLAVGQEALYIERFGGFFSLDGLHFSDTGYALLADVFVGAINEALGTAAPAVDLEAAMAADPFTPAALREAGLDIDACE